MGRECRFVPNSRVGASPLCSNSTSPEEAYKIVLASCSCCHEGFSLLPAWEIQIICCERVLEKVDSPCEVLNHISNTNLHLNYLICKDCVLSREILYGM
jgi:hypothetical protein